MAAEQPIDPHGDGQEKPYHSSSGLFDHHAVSTVIRYVTEAYRTSFWMGHMAAEPAAYSSTTIGRGFSADVSARIAHGRLKKKKKKKIYRPTSSLTSSWTGS